MTSNDESLPLAVLDFVGIEYGEEASASLAGAVAIAQAVEAAGYRRYWVSEHHNMRSLACSAPEMLTAHVGAHTSRIRVGAAGHHAAQPRLAQGRRDVPHAAGHVPGPDRPRARPRARAPTR